MLCSAYSSHLEWLPSADRSISIWTVKFTILQFLQRLTASVWTQTYNRALRFLRLFFVVAFLAVVIATLSECQPFDHYWQVVPDPGARCRDGFAQVITMGAADIVTDIALIALPLPIIVQSTMTAKRKLSLCLLFSLSGILIAITAYRIPAIIDTHGRQQLRTLWASIEILAATAVANALVLGSFLRDRGIKKPKYKGIERLGSYDPQPSINRAMTKTHWGSDEDLFRTVGCRLDSVTESVKTPDTHGVHSMRTPLPVPTYPGDAKDDELAIYSDLGGPSSAVREPSYFACQPKGRNSVSPKSPLVDDRMMTFHRAHDFAHGDAYESGESSLILADEGGLLGSPRRATLASQGGLLAMSRKASEAFRRASPSPMGKRSSSARQDIPSSPMELQDIGGLLKDG